MANLTNKIYLMLLNNKWWVLYSLAVILGAVWFNYYRIIFNCTNSLPETVFIANVGDKNLQINDFVVAYSKGLPNLPDNIQLIKLIAGIPNDVISYKSDMLYINNKICCKVNAKKAIWGDIHPITLTQMKIPNGCYFVKGKSSNSFDSRYKEFGLICKEQILGKAAPLF